MWTGTPASVAGTTCTFSRPLARSRSPWLLTASVRRKEIEGTSFSLFAATATGEVWCSDDGGEQWTEVVSGLAPISKGTHYAAFVAA